MHTIIVSKNSFMMEDCPVTNLIAGDFDLLANKKASSAVFIVRIILAFWLPRTLMFSRKAVAASKMWGNESTRGWYMRPSLGKSLNNRCFRVALFFLITASLMSVFSSSLSNFSFHSRISLSFVCIAYLHLEVALDQPLGDHGGKRAFDLCGHLARCYTKSCDCWVEVQCALDCHF